MAVESPTQEDKEVVADICFEDIVDMWSKSNISSYIQLMKYIRNETGWSLKDSVDVYRFIVSKHVDDLLIMGIQIPGRFK